MKNTKFLCSLMMLAGVSISGAVLADRGHGYGHGGGSHADFGFYFGVPYPYGYSYPYPYAYPYPYPDPYYPRVITVPAPQPPVYIEQGSPQQVPQQAAPVPQSTNYWYHCDKPEGYYPYVKECPSGWQKVVPTLPPGQ
jgi:hypothetical protein